MTNRTHKEAAVNNLLDTLSAADINVLIARVRVLEEYADDLIDALNSDKANLVDSIINLQEAVKLVVFTQERHGEAILALTHGNTVAALHALRSGPQSDG